MSRPTLGVLRFGLSTALTMHWFAQPPAPSPPREAEVGGEVGAGQLAVGVDVDVVVVAGLADLDLEVDRAGSQASLSIMKSSSAVSPGSRLAPASASVTRRLGGGGPVDVAVAAVGDRDRALVDAVLEDNGSGPTTSDEPSGTSRSHGPDCCGSSPSSSSGRGRRRRPRPRRRRHRRRRRRVAVVERRLGDVAGVVIVVERILAGVVVAGVGGGSGGGGATGSPVTGSVSGRRESGV